MKKVTEENLERLVAESELLAHIFDTHPAKALMECVVPRWLEQEKRRRFVRRASNA